MDRREASPSNRTVVDPKTSLALWLRAGRAQRGMSLDDVARVTKIQTRILERLEAGSFDGLPAEVFVRGFVKSVARCVGLDEDEALRRYGACGSVAARALVDTMSDLAPVASRTSSPRILTPPAMARVDATRVETVMLPATGTLVVDVGAMPLPTPPIDVPAASNAEIEIPIIVESEPAPAVVESTIAVPAVELAAAPVDESVQQPAVEAAAVGADGKKKRKRTKRAAGTAKSKRIASGTPSAPAPVVVETPAATSVTTVETTTPEPAPVAMTSSTTETVTTPEPHHHRRMRKD